MSGTGPESSAGSRPARQPLAQAVPPTSRPRAFESQGSSEWAYSGRWALVTGASSGIGESFARLLAARGMNLVLSARRETKLQALARELGSRHPIRTIVVPADLSQPGAAAQLWQQAASQDRAIHLLVNNAGFGLYGAFHELPLETQSEMIALNCTALTELAHLALPPMRARGTGAVINVASTAAFQPVPYFSVYAATKAFVLAFSQGLWDENRAAGVRVLALCPGSTPTGFQEVAGTHRTASSPGIQSADEVAAAALDALDAGKSFVVPGALNAVSSRLSRILPLSAITRIAGAVFKRLNG